MGAEQLVDQDKNKLKKGWLEVRLGDIGEIIKDSWKIDDNAEKYIGLEHIGKETLRLNGIGYSDKLMSNKYRFKSGDILFGKLNPNFRKVIVPSFDGICSTDIWVIREKNLTHQKYLFYFLTNPIFIAISTKSNGGTGMPRADWQFLKDTKWLIPPLPKQEAIAEVLSSLDDKIDLLHRQNKTLENLAQTLFQQWFVRETNDNWQTKPLGETVDISIGRTPPRKESKWFSNNPKDWNWISIKDMAEDGIYFSNTSEHLVAEAIDKFNIPVIPIDTVILSFKMTVGRVGIVARDMLSNEAIAQFRFHSETPFCKEYLYFYLKTFKFNSLGSTSSIVTSINTAMIKQFEIVLPDAKLIERFKKINEPIFAKIYLNQCQIYKLRNIRDTLLPKLMNGTICV